MYLLTLNGGDLLDGARTTISLGEFNAVDGIHKLWEEVMEIQGHGFEKPCRRHSSRGIINLSKYTHDSDVGVGV